MYYKDTVKVVLTILENCDGDDNICNKCPFANHCMGLFTGDWGTVPDPEEILKSEDE